MSRIPFSSKAVNQADRNSGAEIPGHPLTPSPDERASFPKQLVSEAGHWAAEKYMVDLDLVSQRLPLRSNSVDVITCLHRLERWQVISATARNFIGRDGIALGDFPTPCSDIHVTECKPGAN